MGEEEEAHGRGWLCIPCVYDATFVRHLVHFKRTVGAAREQVTEWTEVDLHDTGTGVTEKRGSFGMLSGEGIHQVMHGKSPYLENNKGRLHTNRLQHERTKP